MNLKHWIPWFGLSLAGCSGPAKPPLERVDSVDLDRYQGTWYEIAKLPNRFQDQCVADTHAEYSLLDDGAIEVTNRCRLRSGAMDSVSGRARRLDRERPAELEVRFAPAWLDWLPLVWGDYQILALDEAYSSVLVGEPSREFLWILSRTPRLAQARIDELINEARRQRFPVDRLDFTPQDKE